MESYSVTVSSRHLLDQHEFLALAISPPDDGPPNIIHGPGLQTLLIALNKSNVTAQEKHAYIMARSVGIREGEPLSPTDSRIAEMVDQISEKADGPLVDLYFDYDGRFLRVEGFPETDEFDLVDTLIDVRVVDPVEMPGAWVIKRVTPSTGPLMYDSPLCQAMAAMPIRNLEAFLHTFHMTDVARATFLKHLHERGAAVDMFTLGLFNNLVLTATMGLVGDSSTTTKLH